ncbi:hypothetical protein BT63DRAFT_422702 [Microthyrium microscopicum]|uniref:Heterokaryon incompatibility domain-containing protein n=1 Tax=Microthyrium microscopicum TaxID=703497 RepID=A0A6A6UMR3_9PEZI|nr:hypothetical protein BT63DRAFT_422702 [Microthyrium microscopicum]
MPSATPYSYNPLDRSTQSIRLIEILPGQSQEIACKLHAHELGPDATCPPFTALSYTWGPPEPTTAIVVDDQNLSVRENLILALSSYRNKVNDGSFQGLLWIDAISINQEDTLERSHQVNMMGEIFSRADTVLIWLGPEQDNSSSILQYLKAMPSLVWEPGQDLQTAPKLARLPHKREYGDLKFVIPKPEFTIEDMFQELFEKELNEAFLALFHRDYWKRMWIVQEVLLARKLSILCGDEVCEWSLLVSIASELDYLGQFLRPNGLRVKNASPNPVSRWKFKDLQAQTGASRAFFILKDGDDSKRLSQTWQLSQLIQIWKQQECADPRDRVYALLGLAKDSISADYDKSLEQVFCDAVVTQLYQVSDTQYASKLSDLDYSNFVAALTNGLYGAEPSPETLEELSRISGLDVADELVYFRDFTIMPPWPTEEEEAAEEEEPVEIFYGSAEEFVQSEREWQEEREALPSILLE